MENKLIKELWKQEKFTPNKEQERAILFAENKPLFITAAPGSGKTRVLLWRTVYLIVEEGISPDKIFLSTFTEKAAHQLKEGLKELLGLAANFTNQKYDLSRMYIGTIHSNCRRILVDRTFSQSRRIKAAPHILDELGQYLYVHNHKFWSEILQSVGLPDDVDTNKRINGFLGTAQQANSGSRHTAAVNLLAFFNRLSEELFISQKTPSKDSFLNQLFQMYEFYLNSLRRENIVLTDLSLLQAEALRAVKGTPDQARFEHVIIDEYQDTNTVQEQLVFALAKDKKNLCVVGDDDQALYRFRGSTVENFVEFPNRCQKYFGIQPEKVSLHTNYRSFNHIVNVSQSFMQKINWQDTTRSYRISKQVIAHRTKSGPAVFLTDETNPDDVAQQIARLIRQLKDQGVVTDYNQVAVLFSYLKGNDNVDRLSNALEAEGIPVYAPRAGCFLNLDESLAVFGLFLKILGRPAVQGQGREMDKFRDWIDRCVATADRLMNEESSLKEFIEVKNAEVNRILEDHRRLNEYCEKKSLKLDEKISAQDLINMTRLSGLSTEVVQKLSSKRLLSMTQQGFSKATASYVINRVTSVDWGLLDLFYQLTMFGYFRNIIEMASRGEDEGPMCNLGLITQYISRYQEDRRRPILTAWDFIDDRIQRHFFMSYLFAMYRLGESEFEDKEDPFPKGRVSFITIHQAKGLEFPVVILGGLFRQDRGPGAIEEIVRNEVKPEGEPLNRISEFDSARLFYVALSRAQNLLILMRHKGQRRIQSFKELLTEGIPHLDTIEWDKIEKYSESEGDTLGRAYSYTADYLFYKRCPRQYMVFRKYDFVPARSSLMLFGSLVHRTIEDLHNYLLAQNSKG